jgi:anthranilate phosphoribosyltransferase
MAPETVKQSIEQTNFGVLNIEHILPQWTALTPLRHHFGVRTLMNSVEKLLNPADAEHHISGFYHSAYLNRMADCLPAKNSWIVQGDEGSIDIRLGKKTRVYQAYNNEMVETMIDASDYGFPDEADLTTHPDPNLHADAIRKALAGEISPATHQIALTTAVLLWMLNQVEDVQSGLEIAYEKLHSGQALSILKTVQPIAGY